jgi:serine phosphatase RsbU (regulator of sigma subunit)
MATTICAVLNPPHDTVRLASAGHLPPLVVSTDRSTAFVEVPVAPPMGTSDSVLQATEIPVNPGDLLLLYTDGLIERRDDPSIDVGLERLRYAVFPGEPEVVCRRVMDIMIGDAIPEDDIAVLAVRKND